MVDEENNLQDRQSDRLIGLATNNGDNKTNNEF